MKRPAGSKHSISFLSRSLKKIGRSVGRKNPSAIARQVMSHPKIRREIVKVMGKVIRKDMLQVCSKSTPSLLRNRSPEALKSFCWTDLVEELKERAPVFSQILTECVTRRQRKRSKEGKSYSIRDSAVIGVCAAVLLRHRNQNLNLFQRLVSVLFYSAHSPQRVSHTLAISLTFNSHSCRFSNECKNC